MKFVAKIQSPTYIKAIMLSYYITRTCGFWAKLVGDMLLMLLLLVLWDSALWWYLFVCVYVWWWVALYKRNAIACEIYIMFGNDGSDLV